MREQQGERERERSISDLRPIVAVAFVAVVVVVIFRLSCLHMARAQTQPTPDTASRHMLQMLLLSTHTHTLACGMLARNQFALLTHDWILLIQFAATVPRHVLCMRLHVPLPACLCLSLGVCAWVLIMSACVDNRQHARSVALPPKDPSAFLSLNRIYS